VGCSFPKGRCDFDLFESLASPATTAPPEAFFSSRDLALQRQHSSRIVRFSKSGVISTFKKQLVFLAERIILKNEDYG